MNRRALLRRIVTVFSGVTLLGISVPFLRSWFPSFSREILQDVELTDMRPGEFRKVRWLGRHVYIVRRDETAVEALPGLDASREDASSDRSQQPAFAENRLRARSGDHLVVFANCTHLGCEVEIMADPDFRGFRCPCHRSEFDVAGRVEQGAAAKLNLEVPDYHYVSSDVIRLIES